MQPQMNNTGKGAWSRFWGDKVKKKFKRIFSKSDRQLAKKEMQNWFILLVLLLSSCSEQVSRYCESSQFVILDKKITNVRREYYYFYIYNGDAANWYETTYDLYKSIDIGDTVNSVSLKIVIHED